MDVLFKLGVLRNPWKNKTYICIKQTVKILLKRGRSPHSKALVVADNTTDCLCVCVCVCYKGMLKRM